MAATTPTAKDDAAHIEEGTADWACSAEAPAWSDSARGGVEAPKRPRREGGVAGGAVVIGVRRRIPREASTERARTASAWMEDGGRHRRCASAGAHVLKVDQRGWSKNRLRIISSTTATRLRLSPSLFGSERSRLRRPRDEHRSSARDDAFGRGFSRVASSLASRRLRLRRVVCFVRALPAPLALRRQLVSPPSLLHPGARLLFEHVEERLERDAVRGGSRARRSSGGDRRAASDLECRLGRPGTRAPSTLVMHISRTSAAALVRLRQVGEP